MPKSPLLITLAIVLCSCVAQPLNDEPWTHSKPGAHALGIGAGWGWADFDMTLEGTSGFLNGRSGADGGGLSPRAGGALRYQYVATENFRLGAAFELRHVAPDKVAPLGIGPILPQFKGDRFTTFHFILQPRWYFDPFGKSRRWRMFAGVDFGWIPEVISEGDVVYGGGVIEPVRFEGDDYFTLAPVVGCSYLLTDHWSFDFGALYEFPIGEAEDDLRLIIVSSDVHNTVKHEGTLLFWTFTYQF